MNTDQIDPTTQQDNEEFAARVGSEWDTQAAWNAALAWERERVRDADRIESKDCNTSAAQVELQNEILVAAANEYDARRQDLCVFVLTQLSALGITTPEETYGHDIDWAVKDAINALRGKCKSIRELSRALSNYKATAETVGAVSKQRDEALHIADNTHKSSVLVMREIATTKTERDQALSQNDTLQASIKEVQTQRDDLFSLILSIYNDGENCLTEEHIDRAKRAIENFRK